MLNVVWNVLCITVLLISAWYAERAVSRLPYSNKKERILEMFALGVLYIFLSTPFLLSGRFPFLRNIQVLTVCLGPLLAAFFVFLERVLPYLARVFAKIFPRIAAAQKKW